jgi:hypothetical protein
MTEVFTPFTAAQREQILRRRRAALARLEQALQAADAARPWSAAEAQALSLAGTEAASVEAADADYFARVPRLAMSICPFDGAPLVRSFDPFGFDGPWWRPDATPEEVPTCPHFCVLLGAVNLAGQSPPVGETPVNPGPEVPGIVARLLEMRGMQAVVSRLKMASGLLAYPVAYFAEQRPPPEYLTAGWARTNFVYTTQRETHAWRVADEPWDFDLGRWLDAGRLCWCPPGTDNAVIARPGDGAFPFANLEGRRERAVLVPRLPG